jgi:hypothetical protein
MHCAHGAGDDGEGWAAVTTSGSTTSSATRAAALESGAVHGFDLNPAYNARFAWLRSGGAALS